MLHRGKIQPTSHLPIFTNKRLFLKLELNISHCLKKKNPSDLLQIQSLSVASSSDFYYLIKWQWQASVSNVTVCGEGLVKFFRVDDLLEGKIPSSCNYISLYQPKMQICCVFIFFLIVQVISSTCVLFHDFLPIQWRQDSLNSLLDCRSWLGCLLLKCSGQAKGFGDRANGSALHVESKQGISALPVGSDKIFLWRGAVKSKHRFQSVINQ